VVEAQDIRGVPRLPFFTRLTPRRITRRPTRGSGGSTVIEQTAADVAKSEIFTWIGESERGPSARRKCPKTIPVAESSVKPGGSAPATMENGYRRITATCGERMGVKKRDHTAGGFPQEDPQAASSSITDE